MSIDVDARAAVARSITFEVCRKARPGARWETVASSLPDLSDALERAKRVQSYEAAVFTDGPPPLGGFLYWSSLNPDLLNSTVITHEVR
jgi:hypothetical protein